MRVSIRNIFGFCGIALLVFSFSFETQLLMFNRHIITIFNLLSIVLIIAAGSSNGKFHYSKKIPLFLAVWIIMIPFFLYGVIHSETIVVLRIVFGIIICYVLICQDSWIKALKMLLLICCGTAVLFTLIFWLFPSLYSIVVDFYGYYPPGTGQLKHGYRAGISAHYSQNGIFISVFIMTLVSIILSEFGLKHNKFKNRIRLMILVVALLAFLLNGKRGTLIWCIVSLIITWFVSTPNKSKFLSRAFVVLCISVVLLQIAIENIPSLSFIVSRFSGLGIDSNSTDRLAMWALALKCFTTSPLLGIGFLNYREQYNNNLAGFFVRDLSEVYSYRRLDAHNIYVQVLCEMGLIGFILYIVAVVLLLKNTIKVLNYYSKSEDVTCRFAAMISFCFQIFYLFYSLSGNCLYDMTFYLYIFSMAITCSLLHRMKTEEVKACETNRNTNISECT